MKAAPNVLSKCSPDTAAAGTGRDIAKGKYRKQEKHNEIQGALVCYIMGQVIDSSRFPSLQVVVRSYYEPVEFAERH
jgi:hypothetical protein